MTQPDPSRTNGPATTIPPAAYPQPRPPMMFVPPSPPQRHSHELTSPFRDGFLLGLGFIVASFVPIGALIVLIITLAGIGSASAGIH